MSGSPASTLIETPIDRLPATPRTEEVAGAYTGIVDEIRSRTAEARELTETDIREIQNELIHGFLTEGVEAYFTQIADDLCAQGLKRQGLEVKNFANDLKNWKGFSDISVFEGVVGGRMQEIRGVHPENEEMVVSRRDLLNLANTLGMLVFTTDSAVVVNDGKVQQYILSRDSSLEGVDVAIGLEYQDGRRRVYILNDRYYTLKEIVEKFAIGSSLFHEFCKRLTIAIDRRL